MSSPSNQSGVPPLAKPAPAPLLHVLLGEGDVPAVERLLGPGQQPVRLRGDHGDGRRLLELVATAAVVTWITGSASSSGDGLAASAGAGAGSRS